MDLLLFGAIVIIGIYNLALFGLRREDPSSLYLGVFCLLLATRLMTVGERYLTQVADLPFESFVRVEYLSWMLAVSAFAAFVQSILPREFHRYIAITMHVLVALTCAVVLFTPVEIFTHVVLPFQIITVACLIGGTIAFGLAIVRKREGAIILTLAYVVLFYSVVNDILVNAGVIDTILLLDAGLLVFIFFQSMLISYRFTNSFKLVESQRASLEATNLQLRTQEKLRRIAEDQSESLHRQIPLSKKMETIQQLVSGARPHLNLVLGGELPTSTRKVLTDFLMLTDNKTARSARIDLNAALAEVASEQSVSFHGEPVPGIKGDTQQLKRMVSAVVEYFSAQSPTSISIDLRHEHVREKSLFFDDIEEGDYVIIGVTASEMSSLAPQLLDSMFTVDTTLDLLSENETGLGMSVAWNAVHDLEGAIDAMYVEDDELKIEYYIPL